jgi:hypothetical protein
MACGRVVLAVILGGVLAACGAGGVPSPPTAAPSTGAPDMAITPAAASPTAAATPLSPSPSATPRPTPTSTPTSTPVPVPSKPIGAKFDEQGQVSADESTVELTQKVTWRAPRSEGVEIRVYGVTECIAEPAHPRPGAHGPCLGAHTALPSSIRRLLARAPASDGAVSWTWTQETGCDINPFASAPGGPVYYAIVLAAFNPSGHSIFAIAEPGGWWEPAPGDMPC